MTQARLGDDQLKDAVHEVVEAAVQWAAADYGDVDQLRADAALADAVRRYERAREAVRLVAGPPVLAPDRIDV